jgi:hypothetical protein
MVIRGLIACSRVRHTQARSTYQVEVGEQQIVVQARVVCHLGHVAADGEVERDLAQKK